MARWCYGCMFVEGKSDNIRRFLFEGLNSGTDHAAEVDGNKIKMGSCWIKGTNGYVCEVDVSITEGCKQGVGLPIKFYWWIDAKRLMAICKEYDVDIYVRNKLDGFMHVIDIVNNEIKIDKVIPSVEPSESAMVA